MPALRSHQPTAHASLPASCIHGPMARPIAVRRSHSSGHCLGFWGLLVAQMCGTPPTRRLCGLGGKAQHRAGTGCAGRWPTQRCGRRLATNSTHHGAGQVRRGTVHCLDLGAALRPSVRDQRVCGDQRCLALSSGGLEPVCLLRGARWCVRLVHPRAMAKFSRAEIDVHLRPLAMLRRQAAQRCSLHL